MGCEDISRITKELEGLLMKGQEQLQQEAAPAEPERAVSEAPERAMGEAPGRAVEEIPGRAMKEAPERAVREAPEPSARQTSGQSRARRRGRRITDAHFHQGPRYTKLLDARHALAAAFLVPMILMVVVFIQRGIFPFGEESFLRTDMYHQYAPFFSEFQYKLTHGQSLFYSWDIGMGVNFSALYAYYLASPFNWLLILCPSAYVIEFMTYMIVFKVGLSGLAMAWYLRRHCGTDDFGVAFFGIFYAMSGYMAAYSWNIMWLDCIILFPVIMLGLERLVRDGKGMLYGVTLGLSILSNYYISIMTCIFMVIYFIALLVLDEEMSWEKFIGRSFRFGVYSLLAGGVAAVVLLPEIAALQMTASGNVSFPKTFTQYFPIFDMIARHIGNVETEIGLDHWPNVYCGVAVLMFALLYVMQRKIPVREKAVYCVMVLLFYASFSMNILNFVWHGFHYPNSLPCRQSYIYIALLLVMSYRAYMYLRETPGRHLAFAFWGAVAFVVMAQKLVTEDHFHFIVYYVAILFLALYMGGICLYRRGACCYNAALMLMLTLVSLEAGINTAVTSVPTTSRTSYVSDNAAVERLVASVQPNESFFRMEKVTRKTKNDGAWMHFPSVSLFSSTANADLSKLFKKLGCESSTNAYSITGSTPLIDALFAVKYGIYSEEPADNGMRAFLSQDEDTLLYQNEYVLPLGFWVPSDFEMWWDLELGNPADVQNSLADAVGAPHVLGMVMDAVADGQTMSFVPEESGEYYAYVENKKIEKVTVTIGEDKKTFNNVDRGFLLELGCCEAGKTVTLKAEDTSESMWADIYRFSEKGLSAVCDELGDMPWRLTSWTEDSLSGVLTCEESGIMMTTIPYDEGWSVTVDGVERPPVKVVDAFIGVSLTPGTHTIEMHYCPQGLKEGALISALSALLLLLIFFGGRMYARRAEEKAWEQRFEEDGEEPADEKEELSLHGVQGSEEDTEQQRREQL